MAVPLWERVLVRLHDRWVLRNARRWRDAEAERRRVSAPPSRMKHESARHRGNGDGQAD